MLAVAAGTGLPGTEPGTEPVSIAHTASSEQARVATAELSLPLPLPAAAALAAVAAAAAALTGELIAVASAVAAGTAGKLTDCCLLQAVVAVAAAAGAVGVRFLRCQNLPPPTAAEPVCCFLARASTYWMLQLCDEGEVDESSIGVNCSQYIV
jgi:hypothetical protein